MHRFLIMLMLVASACATTAPSRRMVVISIDGLMPDAYVHPDAHGLKIPTLRSLVARGMSASSVKGVFPTVTYPSHTTIATGVMPNVHGIVSNKPADPLDTNMAGWRWYAEDVKAMPLWEAVEKDGHRRAALVTWPVTVAANASFVVPEYWRAGGEDDKKLERALSTPGLLAKVARESPELWSKLTPPDVLDDAQFAIARYLIAHEQVDLMMMHVWALDDAQHDHAPWSPQALAAIEHADELIAQLITAMQSQPAWKDATLVVVSDHGFAPIDHEIEANVALAKHHLIELDADGKTTKAKAVVIAAGGSALFYALDPSAQADLDAAVSELPHVAKRYSHDELVAAGADPKATFALAAEPTYAFGDKRTGNLVIDTPGRGTHGYPPADPRMFSSFIAVGPGIPHRDLGAVDMVQIAPTLAGWLGVTLPQATAPPLR